MADIRRRRVEVHELTLSGLDSDQPYGRFLRNIWSDLGGLEETVMRRGSKSHALYDVSVRAGRLRLLFMSFTTGYRPDILDVESFNLGPNPLDESQTGVDWTHCVGGRVGKKFLLLIEKSQAGIWPRAVERYFQWLADQSAETEDDQEGVVVNIEPLTDLSFIDRVNALERIKRATLRIPKPNPGWSDLEEELGKEADASEAGKAAVTMYARRLGTLRKGKGIVAAIKKSVGDQRAIYAQIVGERDSVEETIDTNNFGKSERIAFELDEFGQVKHDSAWERLDEMFDRLT